ncbi:MAG: Lrp/AsnC family transcriptional regulator [archaeon]
MTQINEETSSPEKIDVKDQKIIEILKENSRATGQQIAKKAMISHDSANYRIKRLERLGIISKYTLDVNYRLLGYDEYRLFLQLLEHNQESLKELFAYLKNKNNFPQVLQYMGNRDLRISITASDLRETDEIITEINSKFAKIISDQELMRKVRNILQEDVVPARNPKIKIDKTDKELLSILLENSRESSVEIAAKLKLSPDAVIYRMKKLKESGVIRKFATIFNVNKMGYHWYTITLLMKNFSSKEEQNLKNYQKKNKNILRVLKTIGEWNILIDILAKSPQELQKEIGEIREILGDSIKDYDSFLAYKEIKNEFKFF